MLQIIPSVTRVFRTAKVIYVYLRAYQSGENVEPVPAYVTLFRSGEKVLETVSLVVIEEATNRLKALPIRFEIPLSKLSPSESLCPVTVLKAKGGKGAFWQAPDALIPKLENRRQNFELRDRGAGMEQGNAENDVGDVFGLERFGQGFSTGLHRALFHQFRVNQARANDASTDAVFPFFLTNGRGKAEDAALRGLISGTGNVGVLAGDGGHVNKMTLTSGAHGGQQSGRKRVGPVQIHLDQFVPNGTIEARHGAIRGVGAGSENQDINAPKLSNGIGGEGFHGLMGGGVGGAVDDFVAFASEFGSKFRKALGAAGGGVDTGSGAGEKAGGGATDAAGGTDDEGSFPLDGYRHLVFISPIRATTGLHDYATIMISL